MALACLSDQFESLERLLRCREEEFSRAVENCDFYTADVALGQIRQLHEVKRLVFLGAPEPREEEAVPL